MEVLTYYVAFTAILLIGFIGTLSVLEGVIATIRQKIRKPKVSTGFKVGKIIQGIFALTLAIFLYRLLTVGSVSPWLSLGICFLYVLTDHFIGKFLPQKPQAHESEIENL